MIADFDVELLKRTQEVVEDLRAGREGLLIVDRGNQDSTGVYCIEQTASLVDSLDLHSLIVQHQLGGDNSPAWVAAREAFVSSQREEIMRAEDRVYEKYELCGDKISFQVFMKQYNIVKWEVLYTLKYIEIGR